MSAELGWTSHARYLPLASACSKTTSPVLPGLEGAWGLQALLPVLPESGISPSAWIFTCIDNVVI